MKLQCHRVRKLLELEGVQALRENSSAAEHLLHCDRCAADAERFAVLDRSMAGLEEIDAPEDAVARLLSHPELTQSSDGATRAKPRPSGNRALFARLSSALDRARSQRLRLGLTALPVALFLVCFLIFHFSDLGNHSYEGLASEKIYVVKQLKFKTPPADLPHEIAKPKTRKVPIPDPTPDEPEPFRESESGRDAVRVDRLPSGAQYMRDGAGAGELKVEESELVEEQIDFAPQENLILGVPMVAPPQPTPELRTVDQVLAKEQRENSRAGVRSRLQTMNRQAEMEQEEFSRKLDALELQIHELEKLGDTEDAKQLSAQLAELRRGVAEPKAPGRSHNGTKREHIPVPSTTENTNLAQQLLSERETVEDLQFQAARGYWANSYLPGDRELRRLASSMASRDRTPLERLAGHELKLHEAAILPPQPFDPPERSALAVYLHADQRAVSSRQRLLVELGLKGSVRSSGSRPAMNVGVVLDLRNGALPTTFEKVKALLWALNSASQPGDRFSLTVAGCPGGLIVPAERFRHGPLTVALEELRETLEQSSEGGLDLSQALATAYQTVAAEDDPSTPLGSSTVLLVSWNDLSMRLEPLRRMAHARAVEGIPLSVVAVGPTPHLEALEDLALAGQGNRRLLDDPADARDLVERELTAVSRIVARALRLNIRLAPGVQLVGVVGSEPLDAISTQQVRDAENAIDRRIARNLGISADRGLDDDGIQIVIPSFYAEDEHVILLDVVVPGPGPVVDLELRYKDLVWFRNGAANAHLSLARGNAPRTPLELNVIKNLLTARLANELERAAEELDQQRDAAARARLALHLRLLTELREELPAMAGDRDIANQIRLLEEYVGVLNDAALKHGSQREYLVDSLRLASRTQLMSPTRRLQ